MPVTDLVLLILGIAAYAFVFGLVYWTAYVTRTKEERQTEQPSGADHKPSALSASRTAAGKA